MTTRRRERTQIRYVAPGQAMGYLPNRSTWMINIGTHKKPFDMVEEQQLRDSLYRVLHSVLFDEEFAEKCLYTVEKVNGRLVKHTELHMRREDLFQISKENFEFVIEKGEKSGRIDAHVIYDLEHGNSRLQFDHVAFASMIDEEMEKENQYFKSANVMSRDPQNQGQPIRWANPSVYTSYSPLGFTNIGAARVYIRKTLLHQNKDNYYNGTMNAIESMQSNLLRPVNRS